MASRELYGRAVIYYDTDVVDSSNVAEILEASYEKFGDVQEEVEYLYDYFKGKQEILNRTKVYNTEILNMIVENRAAEIVNFKTGYLLSAPIQYIDNTSADDSLDSGLADITKWCMQENKDASDLEVARWQSICGTAYRMITQNNEETGQETEDGSPFKIDTLDPRNTFVVYSSRLGHKPLMGVNFVDLGDDKLLFYVYTPTELFVFNEKYENATDETNPSGAHAYGAIPIIEYPLNESRIGDFEQVISLLDAINNCESDRADATEGFVQSILCLENIGIEPQGNETQAQAEANFMTQLKEIGGMFVPKDGKVYYISPPQLNQEQTQTQVDALYDAVLTICGMPNRNGGSSTSDTGAAVILRDGWSAAESRARSTEIYFRKSERKFLDIMINICNNIGGLNIAPSSVDIRFPRRNYTNDSANVSNLITLLANDWVRPEFAYEHCNMTPDPHREYLLAKKWHDEQMQAEAESETSAGTEARTGAKPIDNNGQTFVSSYMR